MEKNTHHKLKKEPGFELLIRPGEKQTLAGDTGHEEVALEPALRTLPALPWLLREPPPD